ncbi:hypothetical protein FHY12_000008 [Xanthomonas arboricola]|nr:hypothetical protein [Xanthomonas euroxanthea]
MLLHQRKLARLLALWRAGLDVARMPCDALTQVAQALVVGLDAGEVVRCGKCARCSSRNCTRSMASDCSAFIDTLSSITETGATGAAKDGNQTLAASSATANTEPSRWRTTRGELTVGMRTSFDVARARQPALLPVSAAAARA